jgi:hypothetical protein
MWDCINRRSRQTLIGETGPKVEAFRLCCDNGAGPAVTAEALSTHI